VSGGLIHELHSFRYKRLGRKLFRHAARVSPVIQKGIRYASVNGELAIEPGSMESFRSMDEEEIAALIKCMEGMQSPWIFIFPWNADMLSDSLEESILSHM
jgi:hypothetical protein